jgi:hypothetical protein
VSSFLRIVRQRRIRAEPIVIEQIANELGRHGNGRAGRPIAAREHDGRLRILHLKRQAFAGIFKTSRGITRPDACRDRENGDGNQKFPQPQPLFHNLVLLVLYRLFASQRGAWRADVDDMDFA